MSVRVSPFVSKAALAMHLKVPCTGLKAVLQYVEFYRLHAVLQRHTSQENFCVIVLDKVKLTYPGQSRAKTLCPSVPWNAAQDSYHRTRKTVSNSRKSRTFERYIDYSSRRAFSDTNACDGSARCVSYRYIIHAPALDRTLRRSDVSLALAICVAQSRLENESVNDAVAWVRGCFRPVTLTPKTG